MVPHPSETPRERRGEGAGVEVVPHHVLLIFLGGVGDIVPGGLHEPVPHNLGCVLIKLQEHLCYGLIVELVCRGDGHHAVPAEATPAWAPCPILRSSGSQPHLRSAHPQS